jgi:hypothetical protein
MNREEFVGWFAWLVGLLFALFVGWLVSCVGWFIGW